MRMQLPLGGFVLLILGATAAWPQEPAVKATTLVKTAATITGQKLEYPTKNPEVTATLVEIPPGADVGWHEHPNIRYVYVIEGTLTIEFENGLRRDFTPGTIFVEALRTRHHGLNAGPAPLKVLFIDHSEKGQPNMIRTGPPKADDAKGPPPAAPK
ncbi:MAG: cupin domain-containing protein [Methylocapsa sp.]|nr:cupin domain-containing protein [Methylocapsa sp.]